MSRKSVVVMGLLGVVGLGSACSSAPPESVAGADERVGTVTSAIDAVCGGAPVASIDGIPAYAYCGNFDVWSKNGVDVQSQPGAGPGWQQSEAGYGFQCFELASRYMHFKWGVASQWGVLYASQMCNQHPAGVVVTQNPVHGDLVVFAGGSCGIAAPAGHVAVVESVSGSSVTAVQQNVAATLTWQKSCASCFLHAVANGSNDPCASAADGFYCAASAQFSGGKKGDYLDCRGGATKSKVTCAGGCEVSPPGVEDICHQTPDGGAAPAPPDAGKSDDVATVVPSPHAPPAVAAPTMTEPSAAEELARESSGCSLVQAGPQGTPASWTCAALALGCALVRRRSVSRGSAQRA